MSGSADTKFIIWLYQNGSQVTSNSGANGKMITRIKQTAPNQVVIAGNDASIYFYSISSVTSPNRYAISTSYLNGNCTDMVMVNLNTLWTSSNSPTIYSWNLNTSSMITSKNTGADNIESLETLSTNFCNL